MKKEITYQERIAALEAEEVFAMMASAYLEDMRNLLNVAVVREEDRRIAVDGIHAAYIMVKQAAEILRSIEYKGGKITVYKTPAIARELNEIQSKLFEAQKNLDPVVLEKDVQTTRKYFQEYVDKYLSTPVDQEGK
jgi:hypothetical protein